MPLPNTDAGFGRILWPALALADWQDTYSTLHRWTQIVGKTCLALAPFQNHWWHCALHVSARGLRTPTLFQDGRCLDVEFDFVDHALELRTSDGDARSLNLVPTSVADFLSEYDRILSELGFRARIRPIPSEMADTFPFSEDRVHASYDAHAVQRCWRVLVQCDRLLKRFRSGFHGKCSPSHFWWGGFDIACTRFSGRAAPVHPGGIANLPDFVTREAYSRECISAGWWPGSIAGPIAEPAFYAYVYPEPPGCPEASVRPVETRYDSTLHEWILPYAAVRRAPDPDAAVTDFLQSTYEAAAELAGWDRPALEYAPPSS